MIVNLKLANNEKPTQIVVRQLQHTKVMCEKRVQKGGKGGSVKG